jgi:predicted RNA-binding Zn-ribbon protein involved in translation (DUF1610 family)
MLFDPPKQIAQPLRCSDCGASAYFLASQLNGRVFLSALLERNSFVCPDCGRLCNEIVAMQKEFIRFETAEISYRRLGSALAVETELARRWEATEPILVA